MFAILKHSDAFFISKLEIWKKLTFNEKCYVFLLVKHFLILVTQNQFNLLQSPYSNYTQSKIRVFIDRNHLDLSYT